MADFRPLNQIDKVSAKDIVTALTASSETSSKEAGMKLVRTAAEFGLNVRDYLKIAVGRSNDEVGLNGYEQVLCELKMPVKNDFANGIYLQAASETFQTHAGTRALFPEVIDDIVRFATRQDQFEKVAPMLANSRTISGPELLSTVIEDEEDARTSRIVPEGSRIPVRTIRTSEKSVKIYKHGSAIRTTYEFSRRASLDLLVPYANRVARELEISKTKAATSVLINGDGAYTAAGETNQSSFNSAVGTNSSNGVLSWAHLLHWLVARAKAGTPVDTVVMNWDGWLQWLKMFSTQGSNAGNTMAENLKNSGISISQMPALITMAMNITPVISSTAPANKLIGFSKGDTLEELIEAGSNIQETERAILNQTVTMVKTENSGYRLVFGDTRSVFNFGA